MRPSSVLTGTPSGSALRRSSNICCAATLAAALDRRIEQDLLEQVALRVAAAGLDDARHRGAQTAPRRLVVAPRIGINAFARRQRHVPPHVARIRRSVARRRAHALEQRSGFRALARAPAHRGTESSGTAARCRGPAPRDDRSNPASAPPRRFPRFPSGPAARRPRSGPESSPWRCPSNAGRRCRAPARNGPGSN